MSTKTIYKYLNAAMDMSIQCPICGKHMLFKTYYKEHALQQHSLKGWRECLFCMGVKKWERGEKNCPEIRKHMLVCLKRFIKDQQDAMAPKRMKIAQPEACECQQFVSQPRHMYGRTKGRLNEYVDWYESVFEKPNLWRGEEENRVEFDEASGLGKDVYGIVQDYLMQNRVWYHVMVKHNVFQIFCQELEKIRDQVVILPFWCLCDGMASGTQHRHMIVACELESSFKGVWRDKVRYDYPEKGHAKKCIKIENVFHLVRTMVYVSQRKASCDGGISDTWDESKHLSHFHMNRPMHEHSIATLCTLFPGGTEKLIVEQNVNKNVVGWEKDVVQVRDGYGNTQWAVPLHVTGYKFLNCPIPIDRRYEQTPEETVRSLSLHGNTKIYLKEGRETKRCWFRSIQDKLYVLSRKQQNVMNQVKKAKMDQDKYWKPIVSEITNCRDVWKAKYEEGNMEKANVITERNMWKNKYEKMQMEMFKVTMERDVITMERDVITSKYEELQTENVNVTRTLDTWKTKYEDLKLENASLQRILENKL